MKNEKLRTALQDNDSVKANTSYLADKFLIASGLSIPWIVIFTLDSALHP